MTSTIPYNMTAGKWTTVRTYLHVTRMIDVNLTFGFLGVPQRTGRRGVDVTVSWGREARPWAVPAIANHIENTETPDQVSHPAKSACLAGLQGCSDLQRTSLGVNESLLSRLPGSCGMLRATHSFEFLRL